MTNHVFLSTSFVRREFYAVDNMASYTSKKVFLVEVLC
jgi:hypothetical protein